MVNLRKTAVLRVLFSCFFLLYNVYIVEANIAVVFPDKTFFKHHAFSPLFDTYIELLLHPI